MPDPQPFEGLLVLVTGAIPGHSRTSAQQIIVDLGGKPGASVTSKVDLVVFGDGAGVSKTAKARNLDLPVMTGDAFLALAEDPSSWDGTRPGMTFAAYDALTAAEEEQAEVDPNAGVPLADRHLITRAIVYPLDTHGDPTRQVRLSCQCGHRWLGKHIGEDRCPVEAGTATLSTVRPWAVAA